MTGIIGALGGMYPVPTITVSLGAALIDSVAVAPTLAVATYQISNDGTARDQDGTVLETWLAVGAASDFQVRATLSSGSTPSGTLNTWLACSTTREWSITSSSPATVSCSLWVEIRNASTLAVLAAATADLSAHQVS
jgi:hypothetical protein